MDPAFKAMHAERIKVLNRTYTKEDLVERLIRDEDGDVEGWYGVAYWGWGSWEEDVYFVETVSEQAAIDDFLGSVKEGWFEGHGTLNPEDRKPYNSDYDTLLVYKISVGQAYEARPVNIEWKKVNR